MNRSSRPIHENHETMQIQEGPPYQGLSEARRGSGRLLIRTLIRRGGAPSGAAEFITDNQEVVTFHYSHPFSWEIPKIFFLTLLLGFGM